VGHTLGRLEHPGLELERARLEAQQAEQGVYRTPSALDRVAGQVASAELQASAGRFAVDHSSPLLAARLNKPSTSGRAIVSSEPSSDTATSNADSSRPFSAEHPGA